jgi:hypothetical protein
MPGQGDKPMPGQGDKPMPGQGDKPMPGQGDKPMPGQGDKPMPGQGDKPMPGQGDKPMPGLGDKPMPGQGDKPMRGHGLMQAIARVNRVFRDKPGGLIVDYLGLADQLKQALATYTESGGKGHPTYDEKQAIAVLLEKHQIASDMLHGYDWSKWATGTTTEKLQLIPGAQEHILQQEDGKKRFVQVVTELSRAFALSAASDEATAIRDDIAFFQTLQVALNKQESKSGKNLAVIGVDGDDVV